MERNSFSVLFFLKKTKLVKNGEASVCMRITVNNVRSETNIRKSISPSLWNQAKECSRGKDRKSNDLNKFIEEARIKLYNIHADLKQEGFLTKHSYHIDGQLLCIPLEELSEENEIALYKRVRQLNSESIEIAPLGTAEQYALLYDLPVYSYDRGGVE